MFVNKLKFCDAQTNLLLLSSLIQQVTTDTSILDTSTELIDETPVNTNPLALSLKSVSRDVIKHLE